MHRLNDQLQFPMKAFVISKIPGLFPEQGIDKIKNLINMPDSKMADPAFATPDKVDLICGAGFWAPILKDQMHKIRDPRDTEVVVQDTELGNVIFGKANNVRSANLNFYLVTDDDEKLDTLMENYWNADKIPEEREWIQEEDDAENAFVNSFSRDNNGR